MPHHDNNLISESGWLALALRLDAARCTFLAWVEALPATATLTAIAVANVVIYLCLFVSPYNLLTLYTIPLTDLARLTNRTPAALMPLIGAFVLLALLYWVAWRVARQARGQIAWAIVWGGTIVASAALLFLYPYDAADIFDNIMHGRILGVYGANPFGVVAQAFPNDPFFPYTAWKKTPSAYGPVWELLAAGIVRGVGDGVVENVIAFKLVGVVFLFGTMGIVGLILRRTHPKDALAGVLLLGWNPIALMEIAGQGHNDSVMAFSMVAAIGAVVVRRYTFGVVAVVVGTLIKFIPILMLPAVVVVALRQLTTWQARIRFLVVSGTLAIALIMVAYAPFWEGTDTLDMGRRSRLFTTSLPAMAAVLAEPTLGRPDAAETMSKIAALFTGVVALGVCYWVWRQATWETLTEAVAVILLFYLLFACPWFQAWYVLWVIPLAALLPPGHVARLIVLFGFAALSKTLVAGPLILWGRPFPSQVWREVRLAPAVHWLPWLYVIALGSRQFILPFIKKRGF